MGYRIIDLVGLHPNAGGSSLNRALGINDQDGGLLAQPWPPLPNQPRPLPLGQVVGVSPAAPGSPLHVFEAFRWDESGGLTSIGAASPNVDTWSHAINDKGMAVGWWDAPGLPRQALAWEEDLEILALAPLLSPDTVMSAAFDINDSGTVVGRAQLEGGGAWRGFVLDLDDGELAWIEPESAHLHTFALALNGTGLVVGQVGPDWGGDPTELGSNTAFRWTPAEGLVRLFDSGFSSAVDVNDYGTVVGIHWRGEAEPGGAFVRWPDGSVLYPGAGFGVPGEVFVANGINNSHEVVGRGLRPVSGAASGDGPHEYAWIWNRRVRTSTGGGQSSGSYEDLNTLIPPGSGWTLLEASAINQAGQIVGRGELDGEERPFLLVPDMVRDRPFMIEAELAALVLGGVAKDGGGLIVRPGGGGVPLPPRDPVGSPGARAAGRTWERAVHDAIECAPDEGTAAALRALLEGRDGR